MESQGRRGDTSWYIGTTQPNMASEHELLPSYRSPPLVEVVLGVQFEPLPALGMARLGQYWATLKDRYPNTRHAPPLVPVFERFGTDALAQGPPGIQIDLGAPLPRLWCIAADERLLIQCQADRFLFNWRKGPGEPPYPRYPNLRKLFANEFMEFAGFVEREGLGTVQANQCEVSYINHLVEGDGWSGFGDLQGKLKLLHSAASSSVLGRPEQIRAELAFLYPDPDAPRGRLRISFEMGRRLDDGRSMMAMHLTARGAPSSSELEQVLEFLDLGRGWIVRSFDDLVGDELKRVWGRE